MRAVASWQAFGEQQHILNGWPLAAPSSMPWFTEYKIAELDAHNSSFSSLVVQRDKNDVLLGGMQIAQQPTGQLVHEAYLQRIVGQNMVQSYLRCLLEGDVTAYATSSHPRSNNHGTDGVTTKALKDYAPMKAAASTTIHVGDANASDTADLFAGRGFSADKPFKTLAAAVNWAEKNVAASVVTFMLDSPIELAETRIPSWHWEQSLRRCIIHDCIRSFCSEIS